MPACPVCKQEIPELNDPNVLNASTGAMSPSYHRLYDAIGIEKQFSISGITRVYIHCKCVTPYSNFLSEPHRIQWLEWRIRELEHQLEQTHTLIQDISKAISVMDPAVYFEHIEEPSLKRNEEAKTDA